MTTKAVLLQRMRTNASGGVAGGQVLRGAPPPAPTNVPALSVASTATAGADVIATVTVNDADGFTTTGVTLLNGGSVLGAASGGPTSWAYTLAGVTAGTYSLTARRVTAAGSIDSTVHVLVVSVGGGGSSTFDNTFDGTFS